MERIQQRIDDYLNFGVAYVWVINPRSRRAWAYSKDGSREIFDGFLRNRSPALRNSAGGNLRRSGYEVSCRTATFLSIAA